MLKNVDLDQFMLCSFLILVTITFATVILKRCWCSFTKVAFSFILAGNPDLKLVTLVMNENTVKIV